MKKIKRPAFDLQDALATTEPAALAASLPKRQDLEHHTETLANIILSAIDPDFPEVADIAGNAAATLVLLGHERRALDLMFAVLDELGERHKHVNETLDARHARHDDDDNVDNDDDDNDPFDDDDDDSRAAQEMGALIDAESVVDELFASAAPHLSVNALPLVLDKLDTLVQHNGFFAPTAVMLFPVLAAARANGAPVNERAWAALERLRTNDRVAWAAYVADVDADRGVPLLHAALDAVALDFDVDGISDDVDDLDLADFVAQAASVLKDRGAARPRDLALLARAEGDVDDDG